MSPHVELCPLPALISGEVMEVLLMWRCLGESLGVWYHFPFGGMVRPAKECPNKGVPSKRMSCMEKTGKRDIASGGVRPLDGPGTDKS